MDLGLGGAANILKLDCDDLTTSRMYYKTLNYTLQVGELMLIILQ